MTREEQRKFILIDGIKNNCYEVAEKLLQDYEKEMTKKVYKEVEDEMYHEAFEISHEEDGLQKWDGGNWIRYKLFENVIEKLKTGGKE